MKKVYSQEKRNAALISALESENSILANKKFPTVIMTVGNFLLVMESSHAWEGCN